MSRSAVRLTILMVGVLTGRAYLSFHEGIVRFHGQVATCKRRIVQTDQRDSNPCPNFRRCQSKPQRNLDGVLADHTQGFLSAPINAIGDVRFQTVLTATPALQWRLIDVDYGKKFGTSGLNGGVNPIYKPAAPAQSTSLSSSSSGPRNWSSPTVVPSLPGRHLGKMYWYQYSFLLSPFWIFLK